MSHRVSLAHLIWLLLIVVIALVACGGPQSTATDTSSSHQTLEPEAVAREMFAAYLQRDAASVTSYFGKDLETFAVNSYGSLISWLDQIGPFPASAKIVSSSTQPKSQTGNSASVLLTIQWKVQEGFVFRSTHVVDLLKTQDGWEVTGISRDVEPQ
mgnify:CR=1 FL=1